MFYRVKQFVWAIKSNFDKVDYNFVRNFLNDDELKLFCKLNKGEQHHSIRVCKDALVIAKDRQVEINTETLAKVALLHDIGKIEHYVNVIEKSILVLLHKASKGRLKKFNHIKSVDIYYNHSIKSAKILNYDKYSKEFLEAIREHHSKVENDNILLNILREADNKN